jgi:putative addiction module component (TIGR02574 family)
MSGNLWRDLDKALNGVASHPLTVDADWVKLKEQNGNRGEDIDMSIPFEEMAAEAMKLPLRDRVRLAQRLATSLDNRLESNVEELWLAEAERRLEELRTGKAVGIDAAEAFARARRNLVG